MEEEQERFIADHYSTSSALFTDEESARYTTTMWNFIWSLGYKDERGNCELLQFFINCYRRLNSYLKDSDFAVDCSFQGRLVRHDQTGEREAMLGLTLYPGAESVLTEPPEGHYLGDLWLELCNPMGQ